MFQKPLERFRTIAFMEGISFLILLFVAMPLKYLAGILWPVRYVGWAHGVLFVAYCILLLMVTIIHKWSILKALMALIVSFIPFGTFWLDKQLKKEASLKNP